MFNQQNIVWFMLGAVFLTYGLAHGALDHLIGNNIKTTPELIKFISNYIVKGLLLGLLWWVLPDVALVCFILFSAWHFGQADFIEWKIKSKYHFFLWGLSVFMLILMFHWSETLSILNQLPGLTLVSYLEHAQDSHLQFIRIGSIFVPLILSIFHNSLRMMITVIYLLLCTQLPLLLTFGIYFTLQHSFHGWLHLKSGLNINSNQMLKKALPYSGAAIIFFLIYTLWFGYYDIGFFFILLSCISMPHVFTMHGFYKRHEA
jgi:Brp/Blh family beta-carotene 15,15'-monooxygenase